MKNIAIAVLLLATAALSFGQSPRPAISASGASSDVYVGFLATSPDYGTRASYPGDFFAIPFYGGEAAYTRNLNAHWGVTGAFDFSASSDFDGKLFSGTVGPRYNFMTHRLRPYATAQIGYAHLSSNGLYTGKLGVTTSESGFTYRLGGGADLQLGDRFYWRVISYDVQPQSWGRDTPWYQNFGTGVGFRF